MSNDWHALSIEQLTKYFQGHLQSNNQDGAMSIYQYLIMYRLHKDLTPEQLDRLRVLGERVLPFLRQPRQVTQEKKPLTPRRITSRESRSVEKSKADFKNLWKEFLRVTRTSLPRLIFKQLRKERYAWFREQLELLESKPDDQKVSALTDFFEKCMKALDFGNLTREVFSELISVLYARSILTTSECKVWSAQVISEDSALLDPE